MVIGLITIGDTIKFYFNNFGVGNYRTSSLDPITMGSFDYLKTYNSLQLKLNEILKEAGAIIVNTSTYKSLDGIEKDVDIDLSLSSITKDSFINLLNGR